MIPRFQRIIRLALMASLSVGFAAVASAADDDNASLLSITSHATITPLIELYTSEGCNSCPKADNFITELGQTLDQEFHAVPLAFHVDYWNRLGWVDPYSKPEFTARQHAVGAINQQRSIYTPEIVVSGKESRGGHNIVKRIKENNRQRAAVAINLNVTAAETDQLEADFTVNNEAVGVEALAYIAIYENDIVRKISGGENAGRVLIHNYVVRYWSNPLPLSQGITHKQLSLKLGADWAHKNLGLALIVLNREEGKTLQALNTSLHTLFPI